MSLALDPARPSYRNGRSGGGGLLTAAKRALTLAKRALTMPRNRRSRCRETSAHDGPKHADMILFHTPLGHRGFLDQIFRTARQRAGLEAKP